MKLWMIAAATAALSAGGASDASAFTFEVVYTGTVADLQDGSAIFGDAQAGSPFTLRYFGDTARGRRGGGGGGFGGGTILTGGTMNISVPHQPSRSSPISALLTIGEGSLAFRGKYLGEAGSIYNSCCGNPGDVRYIGTYQTARDQVDKNGVVFVDEVATRIDSTRPGYFPPYIDDTGPFSLAIDGTISTASGSFSYEYSDPANGIDRRVSGMLLPRQFTYSSVTAAVAEPKSPYLLAFGGVVTVVGRRRRAARKAKHAWA